MTMAKQKSKDIPTLDPVQAFWIQYPDAPYLLKVGDTILLASSHQRASDLARMAGTVAEKIFNPNLKESNTDAS